MKIRLTEIPNEGRSYTFDRESGELNEQLSDLVGKNPYHVNFTISPIGNAYEMRGGFKTSLDEVCSKCGWDFKLHIERPINEILFEEEDDHRKSHSVHGNQSVDFSESGSVTMTAVKGGIFLPGDYVHEAVLLAEPFYPMCGPNETCVRAAEVDAIRAKLEAEFLAADQKSAGHPAFSVLKSLEAELKN